MHSTERYGLDLMEHLMEARTTAHRLFGTMEAALVAATQRGDSKEIRLVRAERDAAKELRRRLDLTTAAFLAPPAALPQEKPHPEGSA